MERVVSYGSIFLYQRISYYRNLHNSLLAIHKNSKPSSTIFTWWWSYCKIGVLLLSVFLWCYCTKFMLTIARFHLKGYMRSSNIFSLHFLQNLPKLEQLPQQFRFNDFVVIYSLHFLNNYSIRWSFQLFFCIKMVTFKLPSADLPVPKCQIKGSRRQCFLYLQLQCLLTFFSIAISRSFPK